MAKNPTLIKSKQIYNWQDIFALHITDKGLISLIYKEPLKIEGKKKRPDIKRPNGKVGRSHRQKILTKSYKNFS